MQNKQNDEAKRLVSFLAAINTMRIGFLQSVAKPARLFNATMVIYNVIHISITVDFK